MSRNRRILAKAILGKVVRQRFAKSAILSFFVLFCGAPLAAQTWSVRQPMPVANYHHVAGTGTDPSGVQRIYVIGGINFTSASAAVYGYNPLTNTWSSFAPMPTPRSQATATSLGGKIYVVGGLNQGYSNGLNTVEVYDPATDSWSSRAPLPVTTTESASASYGGKLYVFGGYQPNIGNSLNSTYEYNPATNSWTQRQNMPGPIYAVGAAAACNGKIYVIGSGVNYEYTVASNTWATRTPAPLSGVVQRGSGVVMGPDQRIYLINDRNYFSGSDPIAYSYLFTNDTWYRTPDTVKGYTTNAAVHLNGYLYTMGGNLKFATVTNRLEQSSQLNSCSCVNFKGKTSLLCSVIKNSDIKTKNSDIKTKNSDIKVGP
jgi:hypothetical protein